MVTSPASPRSSLTFAAPVTQRASFQVHDIQWNDQRRTITVGRTTIEFTPSEYRLLSPMREGRPVTYEELTQAAYGCEVDAAIRKLMDKHIDNIRGKIRGTDVYIYCVLGYGYILLAHLS